MKTMHGGMRQKTKDATVSHVSRLVSIVILSVSSALSAYAAPIPWKTPTYTLVARDMNLRAALDTFAVAEGLPLV